MKQLITILFCNLFAINCYCQSFQNGDLDGVINGNSCLPTNWTNVPYTDVNCLAAVVGNDTPDLTNLTEPGSSTLGAIGNPFNGNTFVSGVFASNLPNFFQEGIMQTVSGFTVEKDYLIHLRQTVVKHNNCIDKSGSWAVYIDTVLAGITVPTYSNELIGSTSLPWEARSITFTAKATTHLIKFLPMDDDTNYISSLTDTLGGLRMGIDSIGLIIPTGINEVNIGNDFNLFPNPASGVLNIKSTKPIKEIEVFDRQGQLIQSIKPSEANNYSLSTVNYQNGIYILKLKSGDEVVYKRVAVIN